ncbi:MFS transporter [Planotetraspora mira]|uniref:MFS transporter n=1 Tax=Planotetraspora mira TaxID=58121 RepID=A0A8J3X9H5_9ACTN|nr:MFS transporter [Planotetraspora mira]GII31879.1 MFS transporter [Planotetraspora mira]
MTRLHQPPAAGGDIASRGGVGDGTSRSVGIGGRERLILAVLLTAGFTLAVDFSILNVALPTIGADVGFSLGGLQWIATAFSLCAAGFTLFFGRIADLFGRRRLFLVGIAVLGIASLVGGLAGTPWVLIVARVAQGLATAAVTPAALSLLTTSFPEGPVRDRVLGLNGALMAAGFTTGAVLGGVLTDLLSWRWAFFINVAVAVAVSALAPAVLAESRPERRPKVDVPGAVTVTLALSAVVYGLTQAGERSWGSPHAYGALVAGAGLLVAFWAIEKRVPQPLVPMRVLRRRTVGWGNVAGLAAFATETSVVFLLTLYLQEVLGYSPLAAGLSFAVLGVGTVVGGILGPRVIGAVGGKNALVAGFLTQAAATIPLIFLGDRPGWVTVLLAATFVGGIANLVAIVGFMVTATSGLPDDEQGLATGLATMSQQVGITMGIPIMSAVATARIHALGGQTAHTVLRGISTALILNTAVCVVAAVLLAVFLRPPGHLRATA